MPFEIVIEPTKGLSVLRFREIWEFRELFYFLVWRDIKIRYKQTFLGAAWALIRPLMGMVVFTVLFNKLVGFSVQGVPYLLFTFCGVVAWNFFSEGVVGASQSLLANANLISKVYFPRVIIPAAAILSGLVDFSIAFILAIVLMVYFQFMPTATILLLPFFILLTILTSLGIGFWFSSISVQYPDIGHALPVRYPGHVLDYTGRVCGEQDSGIVPDIVWLNPIVCVIEGFRWSMLHTGTLPVHLVLLSTCVALALLGHGPHEFSAHGKKIRRYHLMFLLCQQSSPSNICRSSIVSERCAATTRSGMFLTKNFRHFSGNRGARPKNEENYIWALNDLSFEVQQGNVFGIIGRNGAGKSTLLKVLSRITEPTRGLVRMRGRVVSLLEVGTGFSGELSGRENVFLNGAILGMKRAEIKEKFDEIVAFAEIEKFIDTPVKRYSSGMYMRLAFAVAAHLEPEILIVDEVLAVGDAQFQKKCLGKMEEVGKEGRTVLFVSHNMGTVLQLCNRCILLKAGEIELMGDTENVVTHYYNSSTVTYLGKGNENKDIYLKSIETYGTERTSILLCSF